MRRNFKELSMNKRNPVFLTKKDVFEGLADFSIDH